MGDVIFAAATLAFFMDCVLYVQWCDRIVGADESLTVPEVPATTDETTELAA